MNVFLFLFFTFNVILMLKERKIKKEDLRKRNIEGERERENSDREKETEEQGRERMAFVVRVNAFPEAAKKVEVEEESKCGQGTYVKRQVLHPNTQKQKKRLGTVVP